VARSARAARGVCFMMALAAATAACDGKVIHLGDGRCVRGQVSAGEVLWIGDSWMLVTGSQHTRVRDLARASGAIAPNDDYVIGAAAASTMADVANQYAAQEAGATKVRVVIMDGGTWDTIVATNSGGSVSAAVTSDATTFGQFLTQVATDGTVEHIIYVLNPELPGIPGVAALHPLLQQACGQSAVPCHFLDLQPLWAGHAEYTMPGTIPVPTEAGAVVIADAIWAVMQQGCIAQ
jgi:hypothetical protein